MELFERIKHRREEVGISQEELARRLGYKDRSTIAKIEQGINDISQSKIPAFAAALNTTPEYLLGLDYNRVLDKFAKLAKSDKPKVEGYIDALLSADKGNEN